MQTIKTVFIMVIKRQIIQHIDGWRLKTRVISFYNGNVKLGAVNSRGHLVTSVLANTLFEYTVSVYCHMYICY